jgi:glutathione S-transferase
MAARRHREQPYLSLNPYGRLPTLEEDGVVLFESTAILSYLRLRSRASDDHGAGRAISHPVEEVRYPARTNRYLASSFWNEEGGRLLYLQHPLAPAV